MRIPHTVFRVECPGLLISSFLFLCDRSWRVFYVIHGNINMYVRRNTGKAAESSLLSLLSVTAISKCWFIFMYRRWSRNIIICMEYYFILSYNFTFFHVSIQSIVWNKMIAHNIVWSSSWTILNWYVTVGIENNVSIVVIAVVNKNIEAKCLCYE